MDNIPERIKDTVEMICRLNITRTEETKPVSLLRRRTRITYTQSWTPESIRAIILFLRESTPELAGKSIEELIKYIADTGKQVTKDASSDESRRNTAGGVLCVVMMVYFLAFFILFASSNMLPSWSKPILIYSALVGLALIIVFSKIRFFTIKEHLEENILTKEDCYVVYNQLPSRKKWYKRLRLIGVLLLAVSLATAAAGYVAQARIIRERSATVDYIFEAYADEIDKLLSLQQYNEAWEKYDECCKEAATLEKELSLNEDDLRHLFCTKLKEKIVRAFYSGAWITRTEDTDSPYTIYYFTDSNEGYWACNSDVVVPLEYIFQGLGVGDEESEYYYKASSVSVHGGVDTKSMQYYFKHYFLKYTEYLKLDCNSLSDSTITINDVEFQRIVD